MSSRRSILGPAFGFFVWAVHLVAIYSVTAIACELDPGRNSSSGLDVVGVPVGLTVIAMALTAAHAVSAYREMPVAEDIRFRVMLTIGCDAIATVAIAWQLFAFALIPACH